MKSAAPGRQSWRAYSRGREWRQPESGNGLPSLWPTDPQEGSFGQPHYGFWHTGQKKVDRPDWTIRLITPVQPGVWQGSFSRS